MSKIISLKIRREDSLSASPPRYDTLRIPTTRQMTVLEVLNEIYDKFDSTLAFRHYRCGRRICRSCEVKLNGQIVRGCATLLFPGKEYLLEPAHPEALIKDLVFDFSKVLSE